MKQARQEVSFFVLCYVPDGAPPTPCVACSPAVAVALAVVLAVTPVRVPSAVDATAADRLGVYAGILCIIALASASSFALPSPKLIAIAVLT